MPAVPRAGLVVVEAKLVLGGLETVLDRPAMALSERLPLTINIRGL